MTKDSLEGSLVVTELSLLLAFKYVLLGAKLLILFGLLMPVLAF